MDNPQHQDSGIRARVLEKIKRGRVKMRPPWHFTLLAALGTTGGALAALTLLYLVSFIIFTARQSGIWFVPSFGFRGWYALLTSLPWLLVALAVLFAAGLERLVKHYPFAYRRPLLYSVLGIVLLAVAGGFLVSRTPLHSGLMRYAEHHPLPVAGRFYRSMRHRRLPHVHRGRVASFTNMGFVLRDFRGNTVEIVITPRTRLPNGRDFTVNDDIVVFGDRRDGRIQAFGIRKISE